MANRRLFVGFSTKSPKGNTKLYDTDLINRDLLNHFHTRQGERVMLPKFGTIIWDSLFEPFTESLRDQIIADCRRIVASDPRVELVTINVASFEYGLKIDMQLKYAPADTLGNFSVDFDKRAAARS